ncbi:MAG: hypothetical protein WBL31_13890 [Ilumatobacteraceae bacterium]
MKPLAIWIAVVAVVFGGYALVASLLRETEQVFVVVDTSFFMEAKEPEVRRELDRIDDRDRGEFALATVRDQVGNGGAALVHSWQDELTLGGFQAFGPCSLAGIDQFAEASSADERILITTSMSCDTSALTDWTIVTLDD